MEKQAHLYVHMVMISIELYYSLTHVHFRYMANILQYRIK